MGRGRGKKGPEGEDQIWKRILDISDQVSVPIRDFTTHTRAIYARRRTLATLLIAGKMLHLDPFQMRNQIGGRVVIEKHVASEIDGRLGREEFWFWNNAMGLWPRCIWREGFWGPSDTGGSYCTGLGPPGPDVTDTDIDIRQVTRFFFWSIGISLGKRKLDTGNVGGQSWRP